MLVDKADLLDLTVPEMTVLVGGMRAWAPTPAAQARRVHGRPGTLSNDFFVNLLDMGTQWSSVGGRRRLRLRGPRPQTGELKWTATPVDLIFGSNAELRAVAEVYASDDGEKSSRDFVAAWTKVMTPTRAPTSFKVMDGGPLRPDEPSRSPRALRS
jgi:catalase-peroxidase